MSDTNGQPDPDIRTDPLEDEAATDADGRVDDGNRPRPSTDAGTEEDTASGGPAD